MRKMRFYWHNHSHRNNVYTIIAGFIDAKEIIDHCVARELREGTVIEIKDIRDVSVYPLPFPNSLIFAFTTKHAIDSVHPDDIEIKDVSRWRRDDLSDLHPEGSISRSLINHWLHFEN
jgi:NAD+ diphosphatase